MKRLNASFMCLILSVSLMSICFLSCASSILIKPTNKNKTGPSLHTHTPVQRPPSWHEPKPLVPLICTLHSPKSLIKPGWIKHTCHSNDQGTSFSSKTWVFGFSKTLVYLTANLGFLNQFNSNDCGKTLITEPLADYGWFGCRMHIVRCWGRKGDEMKTFLYVQQKKLVVILASIYPLLHYYLSNSISLKYCLCLPSWREPLEFSKTGFTCSQIKWAITIHWRRNWKKTFFSVRSLSAGTETMMGIPCALDMGGWVVLVLEKLPLSRDGMMDGLW